ncbi:MAG TPA: hypothetical protein VGB77_03535 [Abditibacteriaceae bacterium]|jgi:hypothetical protein
MKSILNYRLIVCVLSAVICATTIAAKACDEEPTLSVSIGDADIPRDKTTITSVSVCLSKCQTPLAGKAVVLSIDSGPGSLGTTTLTTDATGCASTTLKSSDVAGTDGTIVVKATAEQKTATANLTAKGLTVSLSAAKSKIYAGSPKYGKTQLTASVMGGTKPAKGSITFETNGGAFEGAATQNLSSNGTAFVFLTTGQQTAKFIDRPRAVFDAAGAALVGQTEVEFVVPDDINLSVAGHKRANQQASGSATLLGSDGQNFPGGTVTFAWQTPINQEDTDAIAVPDEGGAVTSFTTATGWGAGTVQVSALNVTKPQVPLHFRSIADAQLTIEAKGNQLSAQWKNNGIGFGATVGPDGLVPSFTYTKTFN